MVIHFYGHLSSRAALKMLRFHVFYTDDHIQRNSEIYRQNWILSVFATWEAQANPFLLYCWCPAAKSLERSDQKNLRKVVPNTTRDLCKHLLLFLLILSQLPVHKIEIFVIIDYDYLLNFPDYSLVKRHHSYTYASQCVDSVAFIRLDGMSLCMIHRICFIILMSPLGFQIERQESWAQHNALGSLRFLFSCVAILHDMQQNTWLTKVKWLTIWRYDSKVLAHLWLPVTKEENQQADHI